MKDPYTTKSGNSYEKSELFEYLKRDNRDPMTRQPITHKDVYPNFAFKKACSHYKKLMLEN